MKAGKHEDSGKGVSIYSKIMYKRTSRQSFIHHKSNKQPYHQGIPDANPPSAAGQFGDVS